MSLDDHYDRTMVARDRESIAATNQRVQRGYQEHAAAWSGAVGQLNDALDSDVRRFTQAMRKATPRKGSPPGAGLRLHRRPLGLGYSAVWFWRVGCRLINDKAAAELLVTSRGRLSVAYSAKIGTRGFDGSGGKLVSEMPKRLFQIPSGEVATTRKQADAIEARFDAYQRVPPPTADQIAHRLAAILQEHSIRL